MIIGSEEWIDKVDPRSHVSVCTHALKVVVDDVNLINNSIKI